MKRWALAGFFVLMITCTIISRIYDSVTIPKVQTAVAKRKAVEIVAEGTGTVREKEKSYYRVLDGVRIGQVAVNLGSQVEAGDILFWYDAQSVKDKWEELKKELDQMNLSMEREQISQENIPKLTQTETAQWELELAQREFQEGEIEYEETVADYNEEIKRLREDYEDSQNLTEEELWQQQEKEWEGARQNLIMAKNSRDREIKEAERKIEDLEAELDGFSGEDAKELEKLEKQLDRAREDLADLRDSWEDQVDYARYQLDMADDQEDRIHAGLTSVQEAKRESYEAAIKQQEEGLKTAQKTLEELWKAVEKAQWQVTAAQKQDNADRAAQDQTKRSSALTLKSMELDRKAKERQLKNLEEIMETGGQVTAEEPGVVVELEVLPGKTATGEELVALAVHDSQFEGSFLKEEQKMIIGDTIEIKIPGTNKSRQAVIDGMNLLGETEGIFQANLGDMELPLGTVTSYTCTKQSDIFQKVIPVAGLRKDMIGYYCLVARAKSSVLGEEFRAERVEVKVLYQGSQEVAVEGSIFEEDKIIVGENQTIGDGDRIRVMSGVSG